MFIESRGGKEEEGTRGRGLFEHFVFGKNSI